MEWIGRNSICLNLVELCLLEYIHDEELGLKMYVVE